MNVYKWGSLFLAIGLLITGAYLGWIHMERYPSTSDAYTDAHVVRIAPQVDGKIQNLYVSNNQRVTADQLLMVIDPKPFELVVQRAKANLILSQQQLAEADAQVKAAQARVRESQANLDDAQRQHQRMNRLLEKHSVAQSQADTATFKYREARANLNVSRSELQLSEQKQTEANAAIKLAEAELDQAKLNLSHTRILAPSSGVLGEVSVRPGDVVQNGQSLFPLVEDNQFWVNANFKETDLLRIRPRQKASVMVDMYPDKTYHAVVESISPASGSAFSLLPPENASGNWVKVTQRFPVRLRILDADPLMPLRIGSSSVVTIDTSSYDKTGLEASKDNHSSLTLQTGQG